MFIRPRLLRRCAPRNDSTDAISSAASKPVLLIEPDVFHAIAVENAVDHDRQPFDIGLPAGPVAVVKDDRPGAVLGKLALDCPHQLLAPSRGGLDRLLLDQ